MGHSEYKYRTQIFSGRATKLPRSQALTLPPLLLSCKAFVIWFLWEFALGTSLNLFSLLPVPPSPTSLAPLHLLLLLKGCAFSDLLFWIHKPSLCHSESHRPFCLQKVLLLLMEEARKDPSPGWSLVRKPISSPWSSAVSILTFSWLWNQGDSGIVLKGPNGLLRSNPSQPCAKQEPSPLYYHNAPTLFV